MSEISETNQQEKPVSESVNATTELTHPHAALLGFMGWLTSRDQEVGPFSAHHEAATAAELVSEFAASQDWPELPEDWTQTLKPYPVAPNV